MSEINPVEVRAKRLAAEPLRAPAPDAVGPGATMRAIRDLIDHRHLLGMLTRREVRARYKDSSLGLIWSLIRPLVQLMIYYIAIGRFLGAERAIDDFAIYVFTGLTMWQLFSESLTSATGSVVQNAGIVKKIYLPRQVFPLASIGSVLFNFAIQFAILLTAAGLVRGFVVDERQIMPLLGFLNTLIWATGLALILSALNVYFRDIQWFVEVVLMIGFWLSPIVYGWQHVADNAPAWATELYLLNPVTLSVFGFQRGIWTAGGDAPYPPHLELRLVVSCLVGLLVLALGHRAFLRLQRNFAQEL